MKQPSVKAWPPAEVRSLVESSGAGIIVTDEQGNITYCSPAAAGLFGFDAAALGGRKIGAIIEDRGRPAPAQPTAEFEGIGLRKSGDPFHVDVGVLEIRASGSPAFVWV